MGYNQKYSEVGLWFYLFFSTQYEQMVEAEMSYNNMWDLRELLCLKDSPMSAELSLRYVLMMGQRWSESDWLYNAENPVDAPS